MTNEYDKENYTHVEEHWKKYMPKVLLDHYGRYFSGVIGDFGCNSGLFDLHVAALPEVEHVVGFDINSEAVEKAKEFANSRNINNVSYYLQNLAEDMRYEDYFDFIICFHTLEHIYPNDIDPTIKNIAKSLKPGGHVLVNMPDKHSYPWEKAHVYHPNKEELSALFEKFGLKTIEAYEDIRGGQTGKSKNITALYRK